MMFILYEHKSRPNVSSCFSDLAKSNHKDPQLLLMIVFILQADLYLDRRIQCLMIAPSIFFCL